MDIAGDVFVVDAGNNRVLKLASGSSTQTQLPFTGLTFGGFAHPAGVAVDGAGNVYVTDAGHTRVLKLVAGATSQTELPFASCPDTRYCATGLTDPRAVAVDTAGNLYVGDLGFIEGLVLKLAVGSSTQAVLATDLDEPVGVAVDSAGNIYIAEGNLDVRKLPPG